MAIDIRKFVTRFVEEARDHIGRLHDGFSALESDSRNAEQLNAIFRSAHTIKGSARMLKLTGITETAHRMEDVLVELRDGRIAFTPSLGGLLHRGADAMAKLVDVLAESGDVANLPVADAALCVELERVLKPFPDAEDAVIADTPDDAAQKATPEARPRENPVATPVAETRLKAPDTVRVRLAKLDDIIKLMGETVSSHARLRQRLLDVRAIERELGPLANDGLRSRLHRFVLDLKDDVQAQEVLMDELHDKALVMRMLPLTIVFEPAGRMVRELAHSIGKQAECVVSGAEIELDRQMIDRLSDPLVHLLRNAVDHGLETTEERLRQGKPAQGRIRLAAFQDGGWVVIEVSDDGGGIPLDQVRDKAIRKGLVSAEKAAGMSEDEMTDLIFLPGLSTNAIITDLSGRGVGMDVVKQSIVDELQGIVSVDTKCGVGTRFSLRLPLSLAVMRVLLIDVAGQAYGFTAQFVSELLRLPHEAKLNVAERDAVIIRNEFVPVMPLSELLGLPEAAPGAKGAARTMAAGSGGMLLLVIRVRSEKLALVIDTLLDERDMVIKPLPQHMRHIALVSGLVTTGRNELVSVLHAPTLLEIARRARSRTVREEASHHAGEGRPAFSVLVVDDSLNTREIEKDVLEAWGYRVTLAEDGQDGLDKALAGDFDAILTDVEMPRLDGFSLVERLRAEALYRTRPIVIITSREKEEDKRRGIEVGADAYIVKGDFDQGNLVETLRALLG